MDDVFFGYETALSYWRDPSFDACDRRPPLWLSADMELRYEGAWSARVRRCAREDMMASLAPAGYTGPSVPVRLVVPRAEARGRSDLLSCHVWRGPLPDGAFASLSADTHLSSPAFCFLQMASVLSVARLALLGLELCGTYVLDPASTAGFRRRDPLATKRELSSFVASMVGARGVKRARQALGFVADGAASPMESAVVALLCAPRMLGGYGFVPPQLNGLVELTGKSRSMTGRSHFRCDLLWPDHRLAVEYDSDMFHTGPSRIARDSERRNALSYLGITVVSVTRQQVMSPAGMDRVACLLSQRLGAPGRAVKDEGRRRVELRRAVLDFPASGDTAPDCSLHDGHGR